MKKIVFTGPESSGKTTLAEILSMQFHLPYVKEVAREYITSLNRPYNYEDVLNISLLQMAEEEKIKSVQPPFLICDTDLSTIMIWCNDKFHKCESWIVSAFQDRQPDIYFLCSPDFPWQEDVLREDAHRRHELLEAYRSLFNYYKIDVVELSGTVENRMKRILKALDQQSVNLF